jgi:hypothetical protein
MFGPVITGKLFAPISECLLLGETAVPLTGEESSGKKNHVSLRNIYSFDRKIFCCPEVRRYFKHKYKLGRRSKIIFFCLKSKS